MTRLLAVGVALVCFIPCDHCAAQPAKSVERFDVFELALKSQGRFSNPYVELQAEATLTPPDGGAAKTALLFWDGDDVWKLRFSPDMPGQWHWTIKSMDAGLNGAKGSFRCVDSTRGGSIRPMKDFPLHFERQNGKPFWFLGDTAWALFLANAGEKYDRAAALDYVDARATQGFNVLHVSFLSEAGWGNEGGEPFDDLSAEKLNIRYWQEVDQRLTHVHRRGLVCGLALAWGDKRKQEPFAWRMFPSVEARKRYARFIAARYSAYDTYFLVAGEWHAEIRTRPSTAEAVKQEFIEIGNTLHDADPHYRMIGIHPMTSHGSVREFVGTRWMAFGDYQQNYQDLHGRMLESRAAKLPVVNSEYGYFLRDQSGDGIPDKDNSTSLAAMRHATWDIVMAGGYAVTGFGTTYFGGNRDPGPFDLNAAKNDVWEEQFGQVKSIFSGLQWWKLEPHDELLSCDTPRGSEGKEFNHTVPPASTYWCLAESGKKYLAYFRGLDKPLTLRLQPDTSEWMAIRIDPRTGERTEVEGTVGSQFEFHPPDKQDWLILLTAKR
jgi:hypothetical protein